MIGRLSIRTRLTLLSAAVAVAIVAASMTTIFLIEQAYTHDRLVSRATQAADDLARAESADSAGGDEGSSGGDEGGASSDQISSYLNSRETLPTLLLTPGSNGRPEANSDAGRASSRATST